jgi:hypothetical protein
MAHLDGLIDVSAWTGAWPFDLNGDVSLPRLAERLAAAGIAEAVVSPLGAVLAPDPMPANRALLAGLDAALDLPVRLRPAPVVNPLLATWFADLAELVERAAIPAVRLLPTWHGWTPGDPAATHCLGLVSSIDMLPIIQARMVDERALPPGAAQAMFDVSAMAAWLATMPDVPVVLAGLYRSELPAIADLDHVAVELGFVESEDTLATVLDVLPRRRVLLGTHAPLFEPLAAVAKLPADGPHAPAGRMIGTASARMWLDDHWMPMPEQFGDPNPT